MPSSATRAAFRLGLSASLALLAIAVASPAPAAAFPLSNCTLSISSTDGTGAALDTAQSGAPDATQADPFEVSYDGSVHYVGTTGSLVLKNNSYHVEVFGIPTPIQGGSPNDDGNTSGEGDVSVAANSPFRATGLYFVSGGISGEGGSCSGSGWFRLLGDPTGTVPWFLGIGLGLFGILGLVMGLRGSVAGGILGGFLAGTGGGLLAVLYGILPLAENTPLAAVLVGLVVGILIAVLGNLMAGRAGSAPLGSPPEA